MEKRSTACWVCFGSFERRAQQTRACFSMHPAPEQLLFAVCGGFTCGWECQTGVAIPFKEQPQLNKAAFAVLAVALGSGLLLTA